MQDEPAAPRLLDAVADTLEGQVLPLTDPSVQHHVRVAANLCRIVSREVALEPEADIRARTALGDLLGRDGSAPELWAELAAALTPGPTAEPDHSVDGLAIDAHPVVLAIVRDKLAVAKPGYDEDHPRGGG